MPRSGRPETSNIPRTSISAWPSRDRPGSEIGLWGCQKFSPLIRRALVYVCILAKGRGERCMTNEHPIERYTRAYSKCEEAQAKVQRVIQRVRDNADRLKDWKKVGIRDSHRILGEDLRESMASVVIEAKDWPTIREIDEALREYRDARTAVRGAFEVLTHEQKGTVRPYPE